jgi:hypothetical protein
VSSVWDVFERALRWHSEGEADWSGPDPLRTAFQVAVADLRVPVALVFGDALRVWLAATAQSFNDGFDW